MNNSHGFLALTEDVRSRIRETLLPDLARRLAEGEPPLLIDVREDREWERGRIPGAVHVARGVLEREIEHIAPDRATEIVLYCAAGHRSALAAESLGRMGYSRVSSFREGWSAWRDAGLPMAGLPPWFPA